MTSQPPRNHTRVGVAIVVAAFILGTAIFAASSVSTRTSGNITVTAGAAPPAGSLAYEVTFRQIGACTPPPLYETPWSVTLGAWTVVEPSNATLPIPTNYSTASRVNDSLIAFYVPNGEYQYSIVPAWTFENPTGVIKVDGAGVMVLVQGPDDVSCTTTTNAAG
jgi:hypothetical protein